MTLEITDYNKLAFHFITYHRSPYRTARRWCSKVGVVLDEIVEENSVSARIRGRSDWYTVYIGDDGVYCSCQANRGQGYICWHIIAVSLYFSKKYPELAGKILAWIKKYEGF